MLFYFNDPIMIDPGKRNLLTMMVKNDKIFAYSNKQHIKSTKEN